MSPNVKIPGAVKQRFTYQNITLDYLLLKEERKTLAATVLPTQALVVKAPHQACEGRVDEFLQRKYRWVLKQQRFFQQFKPRQEKQFVSGETFRYRGRSYKLLIRMAEDGERVSLQHGVLNVYSEKPKQRTNTKALVNAWFKGRAHTVFAERLTSCFAAFDSGQTPNLTVRKMTRRWGSYSQKNHRVLLNSALIQASTRHIDYVIYHELCHMTHENHSRAFYQLLESKVPNWQKLKAELELSLLG